jgi:hypothetical protein
MKRTTYLTLALLVTSVTVQAQDRFVIQTVKCGNQVITTIDKVTPPVVLPGPGAAALPPEASATPVVLQARDWLCGRCFTDELARRWCLAYGPPLAAKPGNVSGWLLRPTNGRLYFFTASGSLFCYVVRP